MAAEKFSKKRKIWSNHISMDFINILFTNQGFNYVTEQMLSNLNLDDLANCRLVARHWKNFIDHNKLWWKFQIGFIRNDGFKLEIRYPEWTSTIEHFLANESTERLKMFTKFMWKYL